MPRRPSGNSRRTHASKAAGSRVAARRPAAALEEDRARAERVDADAVGPELARERVGEVDLGRLRRGVLRPRLGLHAGDRRDEQRRPAAAGAQVRQRRAHEHRGMDDVEGQRLLPVGGRRLLERRSRRRRRRRWRRRGPGRRSSRAHSSTAAVERRLVGDVGRHAVRAHAERAQLARRPLHLVGVAGAQPHGAALVGQAQDDRPADPARRAGDEGDLAGEPEVHHVVGSEAWERAGGTGGAGRHRRRRPRAALRPGLVGQPHDLRRGVVVLVGLEDAVARVGAVHDREAAAQARDVDPVVGIGRRVDVGPAHRRPQRDLARARALVAGAEEAPAPDGRPAAHAVEVAQAVVVLGPGAHQRRAPAGQVDGPQLEARRVLELPVRPAARGHRLEVELGAGDDPVAPARGVGRRPGGRASRSARRARRRAPPVRRRG